MAQNKPISIKEKLCMYLYMYMYTYVPVASFAHASREQIDMLTIKCNLEMERRMLKNFTFITPLLFTIYLILAELL